MAAIRFLKMSFMVHCDFEKGSRNQYYQSTLLVLTWKGGGHKHSTLSILLTMLTLLMDPLSIGLHLHQHIRLIYMPPSCMFIHNKPSGFNDTSETKRQVFIRHK